MGIDEWKQETAQDQARDRRSRPTLGRNHWIVVDRSWAERLGLQRDAGVYRIRSRDLVLRLAQLAQPRKLEAMAPRDRWAEAGSCGRYRPDVPAVWNTGEGGESLTLAGSRPAA